MKTPPVRKMVSEDSCFFYVGFRGAVELFKKVAGIGKKVLHPFLYYDIILSVSLVTDFVKR
ncbi:MAG: hypothetical protein IKD31_04595 [Clostridia bacterium]|nr:hypothetical protein [Clostridia bacterium]